jgi:hypothetical protein
MKILSKIVNITRILILLLVIPELALAQHDCVLKKDKDNIKVYSCKAENSKFKTVRAVFELNATIDEYIAVVTDVANYKAWHYNVINPKVLDKKSDNEQIYYTEVNAPWPVSNRDMILRQRLEMNNTTKELTVTLESIAEYLPTVENVVRVPASYSKLTITPIGESKLKVEYFIDVDPGGQIPAWVVNLVSTQAPYETFKNLMARIKSLKKNTTSSSSIVD